MAQFLAWEKEYKNSKLVTKKSDPQNDTLRFLKFFKKQTKRSIENLAILDLGSGTGRNANYLASLDNTVLGLEIAPTALRIATERAREIGVTQKVKYINQNIGEKFPAADNFFDIIIDVTSSNSLNEKERGIYLSEVHRTLSPHGYFFVRALCKEGDKNAKNLLKKSPGPEYDTYIIKELGLVERVFSEKDFRTLYGDHFTIEKLEKKSSYAKFGGQSYKRNYWLAYLKKK